MGAGFRVSLLGFFLILIFAFLCGTNTIAAITTSASSPGGSPSASTSAHTSGASPLPGIAYEEIVRVIMPGSTPPPVGSFDADAAVIAALPPLVLPKPGAINMGPISTLAIIPVIGGWLAGAAANSEIAARQAQIRKQNEEFANGKAARQRTGVLTSFAFYHGWSRVQLTPAFTTIDKPDQGLTMTLDNAKKTYQSVQTAPNVETYTVQSGVVTIAKPAVEKTPTVEALPPARIVGLWARGYRTTGTINVPQANFLCTSGEHQVMETEYVSDIADPQYNASQDSNEQPLVTACSVGSSASHRVPGRLVLYRVITVDAGTPAAFGVALERGNIRFIGEQDSALFVPPSDFKETQ